MAPTALDNVKEERPDARRKLTKLAGVVDELGRTERLKEQRLSLWRALRELDPPVSWADIARVSGVDSVTVIQAVQGRSAKADA
jgi:hypothetical protein